MKSREISRSKIGPFSLACTDPYIGIWWENQSRISSLCMINGILSTGLAAGIIVVSPFLTDVD